MRDGTSAEPAAYSPSLRPPSLIPHPFSVAARRVLLAPGEPPGPARLRIDAGRFAAVERGAGLRADFELGDALVLPGLVNAHAHLDLTAARGLIPPDPAAPFPEWLSAVVAFRRTRSPEQTLGDIRAGAAESLHSGVTTLGDISYQGVSWGALDPAGPLRVVVYYELLGLRRVALDGALAGAAAWLAAHPAYGSLSPGLSPHAPYSVGADLFAEAGLLARSANVPVQAHLAESRAELDLLAGRGGPLVPFLTSLGVYEPESLAASPEAVISCLGVARAAFAHGNYLAPESIPAGSAVVYCPRTHAAFGHARHPLVELLAGGVTVALGTDSLASSPDLDLWAEAQLVRRLFPKLTPHRIVELATAGGAAALGLAGEVGRIAPGFRADLVAFDVPTGVGDALAFALDAPQPRRSVLAGGTWVRGPQFS